MFDDDAPPDPSDPVGEALRGLALKVREEVVTPDPEELRARPTIHRASRPRLLVPSIAAAIVLIVGVTLAITLPGHTGKGHSPAVTSPTPFRVATHATRIGGITLVSDNLNQVLAQAPTMAVHASTVLYPDLDANNSAISFGAGSVWVLQSTKPLGGSAQPLGRRALSSDCGALVRLDPSTTAATGTVPLATCPEAVAFGDGSVWVLSFQINVDGYRLSQVDPATMTVRSTTIIDGGAHGVTPQGDTGAKHLYVTTAGTSVVVALQTETGATQIVTIDAATLATVESTTILPTRGVASALAATTTAAWMGTTNGWIYRIDPTTGTVTAQRHLGTSVRSLSASNQALWATVTLPPTNPTSAYPGFDTLELDPATGALTHDTRLPLLLVSTDGTEVWGIFASPERGSYIAKIDPHTGTVIGATSSPFKAPAFTPDTIGVSDGAAWVINTNLQTLTKVSPR
jgi:hypothetical protein